MRRVVVTGIGTVNPIGNNVVDSWNSALKGISGIELITRFDTGSSACKIAGEVKNFDPGTIIEYKELKKMQLFIKYGLVAAVEAVDQSGIVVTEENCQRMGVCLGVGIGGIDHIEEAALLCKERGPKRLSPFYIPSIVCNLAPGHISIRYGFKGSNFSIASACASGTHAIGESFKMIQRGQADVMVTGGTESTISTTSLAGFTNMKALSTRNYDPKAASRPFDKDRDGFVMSEGAGIIVLEELEHAKARKSNILAELCGYGTCSDAFHITKPAPEGETFETCMRLALEDAGVNASDIDYINAHGTSTHFNDLNETLAIKRLFKEEAYKIAISSTKSMTGHLLGAAGGVEGVFAIQSILDSIIPPTINYETPDEGLDLDYTPNEARPRQIKYALSNSFGFGGTNSTIILSRYVD